MSTICVGNQSIVVIMSDHKMEKDYPIGTLVLIDRHASVYNPDTKKYDGVFKNIIINRDSIGIVFDKSVDVDSEDKRDITLLVWCLGALFGVKSHRCTEIT